MEYTVSRIIWFAKSNIGYLASGALGLAMGLVMGWLVWPVHWEGAEPTELLPEYKVLIANSVAEDQIFFGQSNLSPGAEKILSYLGSDSLQAVNEVLTSLRESGDLNLSYEPEEKDTVISNLLFLQTILAEPPQLTNPENLPTTVGPSTQPEGSAGRNQFARLFSWVSILILIGGLGWVSYRLISPKEEAIPNAVRFNSDLEVEEFDEEEEDGPQVRIV